MYGVNQSGDTSALPADVATQLEKLEGLRDAARCRTTSSSCRSAGCSTAECVDSIHDDVAATVDRLRRIADRYDATRR